MKCNMSLYGCATPTQYKQHLVTNIYIYRQPYLRLTMQGRICGSLHVLLASMLFPPVWLSLSSDSGYPPSISSSDVSSRMPSSISPVVDTLGSVMPLEKPNPYPQNSVFEEQLNSVHRGAQTRDQDPNLQTLNLNNSNPSYCSLFLEQNQGVVQVADNQTPELQDTSFHVHSPVSLEETFSNSIDFLSSLNVQIPNLTIPESQNGTCDSGMMVQIFPELDTLLDQNLEPGQLFEPGQMIITKVESLSSAEEVVVFDEPVRLDTISQTLDELPQLQLMGQRESSVLVPDHGSGMDSAMRLTTESSNLVPEHVTETETKEVPISTECAGTASVNTQICSSLEEMKISKQGGANIPAIVDLETEIANLGNVASSNSTHCCVGSSANPKCDQTEGQDTPRSPSTDATATSHQAAAKGKGSNNTESLSQSAVDPCHKRRRIIRAGKFSISRPPNLSTRKPAAIVVTQQDAEEGDDGRRTGTMLPESSSRKEVVSVPSLPESSSMETVMRSRRGRLLKPTWKKVATPLSSDTESENLVQIVRTDGESPNSKSRATSKADGQTRKVKEDSRCFISACVPEVDNIQSTCPKVDISSNKQPFSEMNGRTTLAGLSLTEPSDRSLNKPSEEIDCAQRTVLRQAELPTSPTLECTPSSETSAKNGSAGKQKSCSRKDTLSGEKKTSVAEPNSSSASNALSMSLDIILKEMDGTCTGHHDNSPSVTAAKGASSKTAPQSSEEKRKSIRLSRKSSCKVILKPAVALSQVGETTNLPLSMNRSPVKKIPKDTKPLNSSLAPLDGSDSCAKVAHLTNELMTHPEENADDPQGLCVTSPNPPKRGSESHKAPDSQLKNQTARGEAEEDCEDFVDIYPDDDDFFTVYSVGVDMKPGGRRTLPPKMPSPPGYYLFTYLSVCMSI